MEKYEAIWKKIEDLKNIKLTALTAYDNRYIKTKMKKVYTNFRGWNVPEADIECESFTVISIDSLLAYYKKHYLKVYLTNFALKNCKQANDRLSDWKSFWRLDIINAVLLKNWYKLRNWSY